MHYQPRSSAVAEGIASAMGSIGKGITAAYQNRAEQKKFQQQQDEKKQEKQLTLNEQQLRLEETSRHNKEMESAARERIESVTPRGTKAAGRLIDLPDADASDTKVSEPPATEPEQAPSTSPAYYEDRPKGQKPLEAQPSIQQAPAKLGDQSDQTSKALSYLNNLDIFSPTTAKYMSAENTGAGSQADVPSAIPQTPALPVPSGAPALRAHTPVTEFEDSLASDQTTALSNIKNAVKASAIGQGPASLGSGQPVSPKSVAKNPTLDKYLHINGPYSQDMAMKLQEYAVSQGQPKPEAVYDNQTGGYKLDWSGAAKAKASSEMRNAMLDTRVQSQLNTEPKRFESEKNVANYIGQRGLMQMLARLSPTYEEAQKDPAHSMIPDTGIAQLMATAESGGVPAVSIIQDYLHSQGINDTLEQVRSRFQGGKSGLSSAQRNQIYDLLVQEATSQASLANQTVKKYQQTYADRVENPEQYISQYVLPKTKDEARHDLAEITGKVAKAKEEMDKARNSGDKDLYERKSKEWNDLSKEGHSLLSKIRNTQGHIINFNEILNNPQGFLAPIPIEHLKPGALRRARSEQSVMLGPAGQESVDQGAIESN